MRTIYIGPFNPESIVARRKLPSRNAAAYNRMLRLAKALASVDHFPEIVTTGVYPRMGFSKKIVHPLESINVEGIPLIVLPALGLPIIGYLVEPFILGVWLLWQTLTSKPTAIIVYNSAPAYVFSVLLPALLGVNVVYEFEDVPVLQMGGGTRSERPRLFNNLALLLGSRLLIALSKAFVAPSSKLLANIRLPAKAWKRSLVMPGCLDIAAGVVPAIETIQAPRRPLRILFAGKLEAEHGFDLLLSAIEILSSQPGFIDKFEFHICGLTHPSFAASVNHLGELANVDFHGFVSDRRYLEILQICDVGLALQRSSGIYRNSKTPSKAYEFLAHGKLLVATNVGDLPELFPHAAVSLDPESCEFLAAILQSISGEPAPFVGIAQAGLRLARECYSLHAAGKSLAALMLKTA